MSAELPPRTQGLEAVGAFDMQRRARQRASQGVPMLSLIGAPVLRMPPHVVEAAAEAASEDHPRHLRGLPALRSSIARELRGYGVEADPDRELLITHGAMHGLSTALRAIAGPGDEVLIPAPGFFFDGIVRTAGANPVYVDTSPTDGWRWNVAALREAITRNTRAILVCNPNNPTGYLPSADDVDQLVQLAAAHGLFVISDESYQRFVYDDLGYTALASRIADYDRLVTVTSLSKNYAFGGWRVGYILGPPDLIDAMETVFAWDALYVGHVPQRAAGAAMDGPQDWIASVISGYEAKRDNLEAAVAGTGVLRATHPGGGAFLYVDCSPLGVCGAALEDLFLNHGLPVVSGRFFRGPTHYVRLVYGSDLPVLEEVGSRLLDLSEPHR